MRNHFVAYIKITVASKQSYILINSSGSISNASMAQDSRTLEVDLEECYELDIDCSLVPNKLDNVSL